MTDQLHRFHFAAHAVRGQLVTLDGTVQELARRREYPPAVLKLLGEMLAAVAMIADGLKWQGSVALQAKGSERLRTVLAEHRPEGLLRAVARPVEQDGDEDGIPTFDPALFDRATAAKLIGNEQLALSLLPNAEDRHSQPYQGLVAWQAPSLAENLAAYFETSEQLATRFVLWADGEQTRGLLLQRLPTRERASFVDEADANDFWQELGLRLATLREAEMAFADPAEFLRKLFAPEALLLAPAKDLRFACSCSQEKSDGILRALGRDDLMALLEERGSVEVTCEFCGIAYRYDPLATHLLFEEPDTPLH